LPTVLASSLFARRSLPSRDLQPLGGECALTDIPGKSPDGDPDHLKNGLVRVTNHEIELSQVDDMWVEGINARIPEARRVPGDSIRLVLGEIVREVVVQVEQDTV
jgi:hypothetical protein